jgi:hypothetical protein
MEHLRITVVIAVKHSNPCRAILIAIRIFSPTIRFGRQALTYIQQMRANRAGLDLAVGPKAPGFTAIGIFLFFGAIMASLAATTLLWRGTVLDRVWALNPMAYKQLAPRSVARLCGNWVVSTPPLGMKAGSRNHHGSASSGCG